MLVWRICRRPFADLSGEGARLYGGRWNSPGRPLIYTAEAAALAVLEVRVHLDLDRDVLPQDYVLMTIDCSALDHDEMTEAPADTISAGDAWLAARRTAVLRVPSLIVPETCNVLINPLHPDIAQIVIGSVRPFGFDKRLWGPFST